jgi:hypothetical protein
VSYWYVYEQIARSEARAVAERPFVLRYRWGFAESSELRIGQRGEFSIDGERFREHTDWGTGATYLVPCDGPYRPRIDTPGELHRWLKKDQAARLALLAEADAAQVSDLRSQWSIPLETAVRFSDSDHRSERRTVEIAGRPLSAHRDGAGRWYGLLPLSGAHRPYIWRSEGLQEWLAMDDLALRDAAASALRHERATRLAGLAAFVILLYGSILGAVIFAVSQPATTPPESVHPAQAAFAILGPIAVLVWCIARGVRIVRETRRSNISVEPVATGA